MHILLQPNIFDRSYIIKAGIYVNSPSDEEFDAYLKKISPITSIETLSINIINDKKSSIKCCYKIQKVQVYNAACRKI